MTHSAKNLWKIFFSSRIIFNCFNKKVRILRSRKRKLLIEIKMQFLAHNSAFGSVFMFVEPSGSGSSTLDKHRLDQIAVNKSKKMLVLRSSLSFNKASRDRHVSTGIRTQAAYTVGCALYQRAIRTVFQLPLHLYTAYYCSNAYSEPLCMFSSAYGLH